MPSRIETNFNLSINVIILNKEDFWNTEETEAEQRGKIKLIFTLHVEKSSLTECQNEIELREKGNGNHVNKKRNRGGTSKSLAEGY